MNSIFLEEFDFCAGRRRFVYAGLSMLGGYFLSGCSGPGGSSNGSFDSPFGSSSTSGFLVYKNTAVIGIYNFSTRTEFQFEPRSHAFTSPGISVGKNGLISCSIEGDMNGFSIGFYDFSGRLVNELEVNRPFAHQTGTAKFNSSGSLLAFSLDEPISEENKDRISKTLVAEYPSGRVVKVLENLADPVWSNSTDELLCRGENDSRVRLFSSTLEDRGWMGSLEVSSKFSSYSTSNDGRYVVFENGSEVRAYDRTTNSELVCATDATSSLHSPVISPDGKQLGFLARSVTAFVPHIVPFQQGSPIKVSSDVHALRNTIVDCRQGIGWLG